MISPLSNEEFILIKELVVNTCGILLSDDKKYLVETRLTSFGNDLNATSFSELHDMIKADPVKLLPEVIDLMTTNETYWFRDDYTWVMIKDHIISFYIDKLIEGTKKHIRIWSAASSTGQEAYSISMLIKELTLEKGRPELFHNFSILGTDISTEALKIAKSGVYSQVFIQRGLTEERINKYFTNKNSIYHLGNDIKNIVNFSHFNLLSDFSSLGNFDIILCRNLAIYFSKAFKSNLFKKIKNTLLMNGILILGSSETLYGHSEGFKTIKCDKSFYYMKVE